MSTNTAQDLHLSIDKTVLKSLYKTNPWLHAGAMLMDWCLMLGTAWLCNLWFNPITYVLAVIIIGARMHALAILMHDASHFRFLKNRKWNDLVTNLFCMYPIFSTIGQYRENHLRHHRHLNTEDDPDWFVKLGRKEFTFPKSKREFLLNVLAYFSLVKGIMDAIWFLKRFAPTNRSAKKSKDQQKWLRIGFYVALVVFLSIAGLWKAFALYWIVPYLSTFFMFQYVRSVAEHFGEMEYDHLLTSTRTLKLHPVEQFFFAPHHVGHHLEHHLYPGVPFYHLPKLHNLLMDTEVYKEKAHITYGFWQGLMNELGMYEEHGAPSLT